MRGAQYKMKITLELLLEKLDLNSRLYIRSKELKNKYDKLQLYLPQTKIESNVLYICEEPPEDSFLTHTENGCIIMKASSNCDFKCEYVAFTKNINFIILFNQILLVFNNIQKQFEDFMLLASTKSSLQSLIEQIYDILGNPAYLVDCNFKVLSIDKRFEMRNLSATWKQLEDYGYMPMNLITKLINSNELEQLESKRMAHLVSSDYFYTRFINCNLKTHGKIQGHLFIVEMFKTITNADLEIAEILSEIINHALLSNEHFQKKRGAFYECFMKDMFEGKILDKSLIDNQLAYLNIKKETAFIIAKILITNTDRMGERISSQLERYSDVRVVQYDDYILALFQCKDSNQILKLKKFLEKISQFWNCKIGISDSFDNIYEMSTYAIQTHKVLEFASSKNTNDIFYYEDYALRDMVSLKKEEQKVFCAPEIKKIYEYDKLHGTDYLNTLKVFLGNERSVMSTAAKLNIHRNTLTYRVERMQELFGIDYLSEEKRIRYYLSALICKEK